MEWLSERVQGAWTTFAKDDWLTSTGDLLTNLQSGCGTAQGRCGVIRAEPAYIGPQGGAYDNGNGMASSSRTLPRIREDSVDAPSDKPEPYDPRNGSSARSSASAGSEMAAEEREREKSRLQRLLKDFAKECVAGILVNLVNTRTGSRPPYIFQMDRRLTVFSLRPKEGSVVESLVEDFCMKDVTSIFKGQEVSSHAPFLGDDAQDCIGLEIDPEHRNPLLFHFDDTYERDRFYTSLQVLRLSLDIQQTAAPAIK